MERIATSLYNTVTYYYNSINPATLSGAIDVVVVEQPNGDYKSTPFHVRFGKYGVFSHSNKVVDVTLNGVEIDLKMKLADSGVAYFVEPIEGRQPVPEYMIASPLPEAGRQFNHTDKVLAESAKKLEEKKDKKNDLGRNRVESESSDNSRDGSMDRKMPKGPKQEQSLSEVQQKMREMPFSSSVFSNRKNRSLPDLTVISDLNNGYHSDGEERSRQPTPVRKFSCRPPVNNKEKLQGLRKEEMNISKEDVIQSLRNTHRRKKSRTVTFPQQPIDIKVENDSDSELDSSVSSGSPSPSLLDPHDTDHIADGALSDSEVDRHRNTPQHANDVTDWKWGQLPETRENKPKQEVKETKKTNESSWWPSLWRTKNATQPNAEEGITLDELSKSDPAKTQLYLGRHKSSTSMSIDSGNASRGTSQPSSPTTMIDDIAALNDKTPTQETTPTISGLGFKKDRQRNASDQRSTSTNDDISPFSEDELDESSSLGGPTYVRTLRLSSQKLKSIGLFRGANECRFSITTKIQGTSWCSCNIYLYKWYEKIVISDIDGTITKSDVLGHVIPAIGGTWAHTGVAELYTRIKNNGYKMVYLSSRAIGQSHTTKQYLKNVVQDSKQLPDGPVLLSPTSVLMAFRREVIERRPEEFKIAALSDLKKLFPVKQPFFAGFGNRETDVKSYRAVDVPDARILIIDPSGMVKRSDSVGYVSNYLSMATDSVDYVFPPLARKSKYYHDKKCETLKSTWSKPLEHSAFIHWRNETGKENTVTDDELAAYEQKRKKNAEKKK